MKQKGKEIDRKNNQSKAFCQCSFSIVEWKLCLKQLKFYQNKFFIKNKIVNKNSMKKKKLSKNISLM